MVKRVDRITRKCTIENSKYTHKSKNLEAYSTAFPNGQWPPKVGDEVEFWDVKMKKSDGSKRGSRRRVMFVAERVELKGSPRHSQSDATNTVQSSTAGEQKTQTSVFATAPAKAPATVPATAPATATGGGAIPSFKVTLSTWLEGVGKGFGVHADLFIKEGFSQMTDFEEVEDDEMDDYLSEITKKFHRNKIKKAIKNYVPLDSTIKSFKNITYDVEKKLGDGSMNTTVFKGTFTIMGVCKVVAIKRVFLTQVTVIEKEITALVGADTNKNIVRLFGAEKDTEFHYLALQLCSADLGHFLAVRQHAFGQRHNIVAVADRNLLYSDIYDCAGALSGLVGGLAFAHNKKILHRDLKPQNILLVPKSGGHVEFDPVKYPEQLKWNYWRLLIGDWGLSRVTQGDMSYPSMSSVGGRSSMNPQGSSIQGSHNVIGSLGYMAPEELKPKKKPGQRGSYNADVFGLGVIFYMALTNGEHPFSSSSMGHETLSQLEIPRNIMEGRRNLLNDSQYCIAGACDFIAQCLDPTPTQRPRAKRMHLYPFFWSPQKWVNFTTKFWNTLKTSPKSVKNLFRTSDVHILGDDWRRKVTEPKLHIQLPDDVTTFTCLQFIRNEHEHQHKTICKSDREFWFFIFAMFPKLPRNLVSWALEGRTDGKQTFVGFQKELAEYLNFFPKRELSPAFLRFQEKKQEMGGRR